MCSGYKQNPKRDYSKGSFTSTNDEMVVVKDIEFYSQCEHHMLPIIGKAHIAYIPNGKVVGLSKKFQELLMCLLEDYKFKSK